MKMMDRNIVIIDEAQCQFVVAELDENMKVIQRFGTYSTEESARQAYVTIAEDKVLWQPAPSDAPLYKKENQTVLRLIHPEINRVFLQE